MFEALKQLGLTEGEIKVYTSLLSIGTSTVGPIIKKANVSSSKIYFILDNLQEKGLVSENIQNKTKHFQANTPHSLVDLAKTHEEKAKKTTQDIAVLAKEIASKQIVPEESSTIYKGYDGLQNAFLDAVRTIPEKGSYMFFSKGYGEDKYLQRFFKKISTQLARQKIQLKGLCTKKEKELYENVYKKLGYKMKYVDHEWPSDLTIVGDYILMLVWDKQEPTVHAIKSQALVSSYTTFFEQLYA